MKRIIISIGLIAVLFLLSCSKKIVNQPALEKESATIILSDVDRYNYDNALSLGKKAIVNELRLKYFAMAVAKSLEDSKISYVLKEEIGKKFDGDFEILWSMVRDKIVSNGQKYREIIQNMFPINGNGNITLSEIERVPLLQIALPINYEKWDGITPILVAYTPLILDDTEWEVIYAYDSWGNEYELDANKLPNYPVMVVGINERCDENGHVIYSENVLSKEADYGFEKMYEVRARNYHEPGWKGDPEVYFQIAGINNGSPTITTQKSLVDVFNTVFTWSGWHYDHRWHEVDRNLELKDPQYYGGGYMFYFYERDGGDPVDVTVTYHGIEFTFGIHDNDDPMG